MSRRGIWFLLPLSFALLLLGLVLGMWWIQRSAAAPNGWTTTSEEAAAALAAGLEAEQKYYDLEAREHYRRALELDPGFVAAKIMLLRYLQGDARAAVRREIEAADLTPLNPREVVLAQVARTLGTPESGEAREALVEEYLSHHPRDPYLLDLRCRRLWERRDWQEAEWCYDQLIEVEPNWLAAQNRLGYLAMAQGRFADAERQFRTYRYVAPDQANPHDSLGELLTVVGRYEEAIEEFEEALRARDDFCAAYQHQLDALRYARRIDDAHALIERVAAAPVCAERAPLLRCQLRLWELFAERDWRHVDAEEVRACTEKSTSFTWVTTLAALANGDLEAARREVERATADTLKEGPTGLHGPPDLAHLQGVLAIGEGRFASAVEAFAKADRGLDYWGQQPGMFKLYNRLHLVNALGGSGRDGEAAALLEEVRAVNPSFAEDYLAGHIPLPQPVRPPG